MKGALSLPRGAHTTCDCVVDMILLSEDIVNSEFLLEEFQRANKRMYEGLTRLAFESHVNLNVYVSAWRVICCERRKENMDANQVLGLLRVQQGQSSHR
jgi:hypothetical protein